MAKQRYINTRFWIDDYVIKLEPLEKLTYLYLLTNPCTNIAGIYEISLGLISLDTKVDTKTTKRILNKLQKHGKIYWYDGYIIICNFPKHQEYEKKPKIRIGIDSIIDKLPEKIKKYILTIPYQYSSTNTNTNLNTNLNKEKTSSKEEEKPSFFKCSFCKNHKSRFIRIYGHILLQRGWCSEDKQKCLSKFNSIRKQTKDETDAHIRGLYPDKNYPEDKEREIQKVYNDSYFAIFNKHIQDYFINNDDTLNAEAKRKERDEVDALFKDIPGLKGAIKTI